MKRILEISKTKGQTIFIMPDEVYEVIDGIFSQSILIGEKQTIANIYNQLSQELKEKIDTKKYSDNSLMFKDIDLKNTIL